jgi:hypothetical protein
MVREQRGRIAAGFVLIAVGLYFLAAQLFPGLNVFSLNESNWPLLIVSLGAIFLLAALLTWTPGLMVPAAVLGGLGVLFYWQNVTDTSSSWSFAWTLIPGFVGVGILLMYLMQGNLREALRRGGSIILLSVAAFGLLSSFPGILELVAEFWGCLVALYGMFVIAQRVRRQTSGG